LLSAFITSPSTSLGVGDYGFNQCLPLQNSRYREFWWLNNGFHFIMRFFICQWNAF